MIFCSPCMPLYIFSFLFPLSPPLTLSPLFIYLSCLLSYYLFLSHHLPFSISLYLSLSLSLPLYLSPHFPLSLSSSISLSPLPPLLSLFSLSSPSFPSLSPPLSYLPTSLFGFLSMTQQYGDYEARVHQHGFLANEELLLEGLSVSLTCHRASGRRGLHHGMQSMKDFSGIPLERKIFKSFITKIHVT